MYIVPRFRLLHFFILGIVVLLAACANAPYRWMIRRDFVVGRSFFHPYYLRNLRAESWENLPGWADDSLIDALGALRQQCVVLSKMELWRKVCEASQNVDEFDPYAIHFFFERHFKLLQLSNPDGSTEGLVTGYYEPVLSGSLNKEGKFTYPLYHWPNKIPRGFALPERRDLLTSNLLKGNEIVYLDDPIEAFFLQIQGSGRILLQDGRMIRIGFDGANNYPYHSIGEWLMQNKAIGIGQANKQGIKEWVKKHPDKLIELLAVNPRYVFFRILSDCANVNSHCIYSSNWLQGPIGTLGIPLTAERSVAVDSKIIPLGTPIFLSTQGLKRIHRLVFAQDTGAAIKGAVRADYFFGVGEKAGEKAERMKQLGYMWLLIPK